MKFIKKILLLINILAVIILLSLYFNVLINVNNSFIVSFYPFLFYGAIIINICFVFIWLLIKWKYFLISFIALIIGIKSISAIFPITSYFSDSSQESEFKVMSYNVMLFGYYHWKEKDMRKDSIIDVITTYNPDIICLQEVFWNDQDRGFAPIKNLENKFEKVYTHRYAMAKAAGTQNFGLATISKYPIVGESYLGFDDSFNGVLISDILINNDTLRFYNVHMQSIQLNQNDYTVIETINDSIDNIKIKLLVNKIMESSKKRAIQTKILEEEIERSPYPIFICGDLNDFPLSFTYLKLLSGLKDTYSSKGKFPGYTWDNFGIKQRIDVIFYNKNYLCTHHKLIREGLSDHFPIIAGFKKIK